MLMVRGGHQRHAQGRGVVPRPQPRAPGYPVCPSAWQQGGRGRGGGYGGGFEAAPGHRLAGVGAAKQWGAVEAEAGPATAVHCPHSLGSKPRTSNLPLTSRTAAGQRHAAQLAPTTKPRADALPQAPLPSTRRGTALRTSACRPGCGNLPVTCNAALQPTPPPRWGWHRWHACSCSSRPARGGVLV